MKLLRFLAEGTSDLWGKNQEQLVWFLIGFFLNTLSTSESIARSKQAAYSQSGMS